MSALGILFFAVCCFLLLLPLLLVVNKIWKEPSVEDVLQDGIVITQRDSVLILSFNNKIVTDNHIRALCQKAEILMAEHTKFLIDLRDIYFSDATPGIFIKLYKNAKTSKRDIKVVLLVTSDIYNVIRITKLHRAFHVYFDENSALADL